MAKSINQKMKLLYLMDIMKNNTDENHSLTMSEIISSLAKYGIAAERKTIYDDLEALRHYGIDIETVKTRTTGYYVANRLFELPELKLLVDAVQCSKFITHKKSNQLIRKIEGFASRYEAQELQRQVFVNDRVKTMNESIYYNVDTIHKGILSNVQLEFKYTEYNIKKERHFKKNGGNYRISPITLSWNDGNYYLIGYDEETQDIRHYRVDKMAETHLTEDKRKGTSKIKKTDIANYCNKVFGMFRGRDEKVRLHFNNVLIGVVIDRFGKNVKIFKVDEEHFEVSVLVSVSPQFFGWIAGLNTQVKIVSPAMVVDEYKQYLEGLLKTYKE